MSQIYAFGKQMLSLLDVYIVFYVCGNLIGCGLSKPAMDILYQLIIWHGIHLGTKLNVENRSSTDVLSIFSHTKPCVSG